MKPVKSRLAAPGPVEVPPQVLQAMARPPLHHRSDAFATQLVEAREVLADLAALPGGDVAILSGNGTTAFEAAFLATVPRGVTVVAAHAGKFGARWATVARTHGHPVVDVTAPWGASVAPDALADAVAAAGDAVGAVTLVHSETSTGALHDVAAQAAAVRAVAPHVRIVVDAVTSFGVSELRPEGWGLDAFVAGSQKGVLLPPGLGFVWLSDRVRAAPPDPPRSVALDVHGELEAQKAGRTRTTPAVALVAGLAAVRPVLLADGVEALWARRARLARALLAAGEAAGLTAFAERPSPAVAALRVPDGTAAPDVVAAFARRGVRIAGGQDDAKGFLIRPSLLGHADAYDALGLAGTLEAALREVGLDVPYGAATGAAAAVLEAD
ncbi:MAG: aminotransferase class V-fold PLP-dependent enzyme [Trueperaceae bacterium]|nr:aminotransferase class V-fold PLP-dependent enzyme [Trueperaceae bacterium]